MMYLLDQVPTWVWLLVTALGAGALFYFFSPLIMAVSAITPKPVKIALGAIAAGVAAFMYGRYRGNKTAKELEAERDKQAVEKRSEINASVKNATDAELDKRADRWMRD